MKFDPSESFAHKEDLKDPLKSYRDKFYIPKNKNKEDLIYFCGNSLGLQPKAVPKVLKKRVRGLARKRCAWPRRSLDKLS